MKTTFGRWLFAGIAVMALGFAAIAIYPSVAQAANGAQDTVEHGGGLRDFGRFGLRGFGFDRSQHEEMLAEELGVTVEELEAAQEAVRDAALDQAVEEGRITQEQADLLRAGAALRDYLSGMTEDAIQQAVEDGVITQEQADALVKNGRFGMGENFGHGGMRGRGGHFGDRMFGGPGINGRGWGPDMDPNSLPEDVAPQSDSGSLTVPSSAL